MCGLLVDDMDFIAQSVLRLFCFWLAVLVCMPVASADDEITPYKFSSYDELSALAYEVPDGCRYSLERENLGDESITYYFSRPKAQEDYPIAILCGGSSSPDSITSIIHFHRYFLKEFLNLGCGVLTVEQWGVTDRTIDTKTFLEHYTRSQRLEDHERVMNNLRSHPPEGWNGKFVLLGVSEGGPIVSALTSSYSEDVLATIIWSGAGDWSWDEELWVFIEALRRDAPWWIKLRSIIPEGWPFSTWLPSDRSEFDQIMRQALMDPSSDRFFMDMTYKYHADALTFPVLNYAALRAPVFVVGGALDSAIGTSDAFVEKAKTSGVDITYLRIDDMDHYVRKRPDVINRSFEWLKERL